MIVMEKIMARDGKNICTCSRCVDAVAALALNLLPPHYYAEPHEESETGSPWLMVETAVVEAVDRIAQKPGHAIPGAPSDGPVSSARNIP